MGTVEIEVHDLYCYLLSECRYGYTRNNLSMPNDAYASCYKYLPVLSKVDSGYGLSLAKQLCEECISRELSMQFYDGDDDKYGNREKTIEFIKWLLKWIKDNDCFAYHPYNYDLYLKNIAINDEPQYLVSELFGYDIDSHTYKKAKLLNGGRLMSKNEYDNYLFVGICGVKEGQTLTYNKISLSKNNDHYGKMIKHVYRMFKPINRVFLVEKQEKNK